MTVSLHAEALDVDRYLRRIGYEGDLIPSAETLRSLQLQHHYSVPFENLDIHYGVPITLDLGRIEEKIVRNRRGGFCYELNGLFAALLEQLGFAVSLLSARVARPDGSFGPEFDHLVLHVDLDEPWLADVGFGDSFRAPLRLAPGVEQPDTGRVYRIEDDGAQLVLNERRPGEEWKPQYAFTLQPRALENFTAMCIIQQTSPDIHFTQHRVCSIATSDGRVTLADDRLIITTPSGRDERPLLDDTAVATALREHFGITLPRASPVTPPPPVVPGRASRSTAT